MVFQNMVKLGNKNKDFWLKLKKCDTMILMKTWIDEKG